MDWYRWFIHSSRIGSCSGWGGFHLASLWKTKWVVYRDSRLHLLAIASSSSDLVLSLVKAAIMATVQGLEGKIVQIKHKSLEHKVYFVASSFNWSWSAFLARLYQADRSQIPPKFPLLRQSPHPRLACCYTPAHRLYAQSSFKLKLLTLIFSSEINPASLTTTAKAGQACWILAFIARQRIARYFQSHSGAGSSWGRLAGWIYNHGTARRDNLLIKTKTSLANPAKNPALCSKEKFRQKG